MFTRKTILGVVLLLCITLVVPALATTYYVDPNGNDSADGNTWATAFATIQKGITSANDGEPNNYAVIDINSGIYETGPITINNNNIELNFRENVEVLAKSNNDPNEPNLFANSELFKARNKSGILFDGNNTVFRMRKSEYTTVVQDVIALYSCSNVTILNLACKDGGEDGIYIGDANSGGLRCCQNISIKNVICDNNKRNAISVISVDGLTIEDCILKNTNGAAPECGIDLEPNYDIEQLMNIVVNNTRLENNASKA